MQEKGFEISNLRGNNGYLYLQDIVLSKDKPPMARLEFEINYGKSINREPRILAVNKNLYYESKEMEQYKNGYTISEINPFTNTVTFLNGITIKAGEIVGDVSENDKRRIQIRETIILLQSSWETKQIEFDLDLPDCMIVSDEELLQQVWMNIINNAIKFSNNNGKISVQLKSHSHYISINIIDYGCGMDEETLKHIFDKFYQGDKSHSKEGNGLGLALVKRIVSLCKGEVTAKSKLNEGTTITVNLPIYFN